MTRLSDGRHDGIRSEPPLFSVIVPTYNRPHCLHQCLEALSLQDFDPNCFEVIVVDDGSFKSLQPLLEPFAARLRLQLLWQPNAGPATARNTGAAHAQGSFLAFTDDDCQPASSWLRSLEKQTSAAPHCLIGGSTLNALPHNAYSTASQVLIDALVELYNANPHQGRLVISSNLCLSAEHFQSLGGFDQRFRRAAAEDRDFCNRWLNDARRIIYAPEVQVLHAHSLNLGSYWRQHFHYGRGAFLFRRRRVERGGKALQLEALGFYVGLITYPFRHRGSQPAVLTSLLLALAQFATAAGFFREMLSPRPVITPRVH